MGLALLCGGALGIKRRVHRHRHRLQQRGRERGEARWAEGGVGGSDGEGQAGAPPAGKGMRRGSSFLNLWKANLDIQLNSWRARSSCTWIWRPRTSCCATTTTTIMAEAEAARTSTPASTTTSTPDVPGTPPSDLDCTEPRAQTLKALHPGSSEDAKRRRETPSTACPAEKLYAETP